MNPLDELVTIVFVVVVGLVVLAVAGSRRIAASAAPGKVR